MITLEGLGKSFNGLWAVRNLSLEIPEGEIFGLVGPNGAGKTTAIRMMTGLLIPTEGRAIIGGHDMNKEPLKAKSRIGYVPDRAFFYEKLSAYEFLSFVCSVYGMQKNDARRKIDGLLTEFGLGGREADLIESYSQGMKQRLLFASALVHSPGVIIIDEPFVGLDPFGVILIKDKIRALSNEGMAVFLATHSLHIAGELCHRVGLIKEGTVTALKSMDEIRSSDGGLEEFFLRAAGPTGPTGPANSAPPGATAPPKSDPMGPTAPPKSDP